ncbi:MAG TPA: CocE/NonD family hydrolase, partial [Candidatus Poseidoniales archaeon]|nr:CocE/NonD family hydrolase [Candidatus Poseidoniales archaeon]
LNIAVGATTIVIVIFMVLASVWGTVSSMGGGYGPNGQWEWWEVPLEHRHTMGLNVSGERSVLPETGPYNWSGPTEYFVDVNLPASEQDAGYPEPAVMHVALWMPDVPNGTEVPVIATVHPYYDFGGEGLPGAGDDSNPNTVPDGGIGQWVLDQFVPYGFALAQISTFGTGKSTHCQDVKGLGEQIGIQAAVHWLGEQEWSNGNVGLMGKSYAGTTNWEAAQNPSPHLKTIVPISGSIGVQQMFYRNGSSEARAMLYDVLYEGATTDATEDDLRMCSDDVIGPISPFTTWAGAGLGGDEWNDYWDERYHLQDVLDNYQGSVYLVWGFQDWNVDPYHAFPTFNMLNDAGIHTRAIVGQWAHNYPDQPDRHDDLASGYGAEGFPNMSRMDWAIELYNWFNYYLKDIGDEPEPMVQIQTNDGRWHVEETWPPEDVELLLQDLSSEWNGASGTVNGFGSSVSMTSSEFDNETHISGLPTLHLEVTTQLCNGGQIFATMYDDTANLRLGHATMDIRYRDGGYDAKVTAPATSYTMLMEFNPVDIVLPAGHALRIELTETGEDSLPGPCASNIAGGLSVSGGVIGLPLIDRPVDDDRWFLTPAWWDQQPIPA